MSRHIVTCLVQNGPLAFARVAGVCAQRRYTVESLIAIPSEDPGVIRITLVIEADPLRLTMRCGSWTSSSTCSAWTCCRRPHR